MNYLMQVLFLLFIYYFAYSVLFGFTRKPVGEQFLCRQNSQVGSGHWSSISDRFYDIPCCSRKFAGECKYPASHLNMKVGNKTFRTFQGLEYTYSRFYGNTCKCKNPDPMKWKPKSCKMMDIDGQLLCKLLRNRTVLFIGDSSMEQSAAALINVIRLDKGGCETSVTHGLSDTLVLSPKPYDPQDRGLYWLDWVEIYKPSIVIMNVGAHISTVKQYTEILTQVKMDYSTRTDDFELIWKTINPGGCSTEPNVDIDWSVYNASNKYQYPRYDKFDRIAKNILGPSVPVLDMSPLKKRGDAHPSSHGSSFQGKKDCLHYCWPGPLTFIARILQQHLLVARD